MTAHELGFVGQFGKRAGDSFSFCRRQIETLHLPFGKLVLVYLPEKMVNVPLRYSLDKNTGKEILPLVQPRGTGAGNVILTGARFPLGFLLPVWPKIETLTRGDYLEVNVRNDVVWFARTVRWIGQL